MTALPDLIGDDSVARWLTVWTAAVEARVARALTPAHLGSPVDPTIFAERELERLRPAMAEVPATWLRTRLGLSPTEERALWIAIVATLGDSVRAMLLASDPSGDGALTVTLLRRTTYGDTPSLAGWHELGVDGPLFRLGLLQRRGSGTGHPETVEVAPRVVALALGDRTVDSALRDLVTTTEPGVAAADALSVPANATAALRLAVAQGRFVLACGGPGTGRRSLLRAILRERDGQVLEIDARQLSRDPQRLVAEVRALVRECRLLAAVPLVRNLDVLAGADDASPDLLAVVDRELVAVLAGPILATAEARPTGTRWTRPPAVEELAPLTASARASLWRRLLPLHAADADAIATQFAVAPGQICDVASALAAAGIEPGVSTIHAQISAMLDERLQGLARRITVTQSWRDLVLPADQLEPVRELIARIRQRRLVYEDWGFANKVGRGLGIAALFSGAPGTGKTMIAGLIAGELGLPLYQVDVAALTSKWIGETEKNLAALFDAAEAGHAVLLFDEADAMFGKRTEARSSNDRHANAQTNYLLQRLESFTGICVLTSNHEEAIDPAFKRRLTVHVRLTTPEADERARLWRALLPDDAPVAPDLDVATLAEELVMSGGHIRNAIVRAAFLAADEGTSIGMAHLWHAGVAEYEAIGKLVPSS